MQHFEPVRSTAIDRVSISRKQLAEYQRRIWELERANAALKEELAALKAAMQKMMEMTK